MNQPIAKGFPRLGLLQIGIILLAVITALIHLYLGVSDFIKGRAGPLPIMFIFNFVGYIVLVTALYLPPLQRIHLSYEARCPWRTEKRMKIRYLQAKRPQGNF